MIIDSPSATIQLCLIGCGAISELHYAPALAALRGRHDFNVSAIVDPNAMRRQLLHGYFKDAVPLSSVNDLGQSAYDASIIASPQRFHAAQAIELLDRGIHVFCEKPMSGSALEAEQMVAAAEKVDRVLAIGHFRRFFPSSELVAGLIESKALGQAKSFSWVEGGRFNWPAATPSFFDPKYSAGGVFADMGVYVLDLLINWFGEPIEVQYEDDAQGGLEANARLTASFAGGVSGTVRLSRDTPLPTKTVIEFERGSVSFCGASADQVTLTLDGVEHRLDSKIVDAAGLPSRTYQQAFMAQIIDFVQAIRSGGQPRVTGQDGMVVMRWIERCYSEKIPLERPWIESQ